MRSKSVRSLIHEEAVVGVLALAMILGAVGVARAIDNNVREQAMNRATQIAQQHIWTKESATELEGRNGVFLVSLRADSDGLLPREIIVPADDSRGQALLAVPNGSRVAFINVEGQRFSSRRLEYNYLEPRLIDPTDQ